MIPARKIKRELLRVWLKFYDGLQYPFDRIRQNHYDNNFQGLTKLTDGKAPFTGKVAIFLIYQPEDFARSISVTTRFLSEKGYSVLLVSSAPIPADEKLALEDQCWKTLERPNYGYDFGGYRDGVRILQETGSKLQKLIILNDSIWFPISKENAMLDRLEQTGLDFVSPVFENKPGRSRKNQHFQSYFTVLQARAIQCATFWDYWRTYRISSKKRTVLLRGEKGFSQAMFKAGFGGNAPSTRSILVKLLQKQPNGFLQKTLQYAAYEDPANATYARQLLRNYSDTDAWRKDALQHMERALGNTQPMGLFCYACVTLLDFSFLKKSSYPIVHDGMRWQYLRAVRNGDLPEPHPDILAEIMASKMDGSLTTDPSIPAPVSATKAR